MENLMDTKAKLNKQKWGDIFIPLSNACTHEKVCIRLIYEDTANYRDYSDNCKFYVDILAILISHIIVDYRFPTRESNCYLHKIFVKYVSFPMLWL